jgi:hypothetical protein
MKFGDAPRRFTAADLIAPLPAAIGIGANMAFRRHLLASFPKVNVDTADDDMLFSLTLRAGYEIAYVPAATVSVELRSGWIEQMARIFKYGGDELRAFKSIAPPNAEVGWACTRRALQIFAAAALRGRMIESSFALAQLAGTLDGALSLIRERTRPSANIER